ncbi:MAG TPA: glycosyltransferase family 87 protein [Candidatus Limnocylindrales bacterium]|nr:glycosyltransferase family 87 protein [Candidatus Limnocylindrales bacterium]
MAASRPAVSLDPRPRDPAGRLRRAALAALIAAAATLYAVVLVQAAGSHQDLTTYLGAAGDLLQGRPLYAAFLHHPFPDPTLRPAYIYPPVFALLAVPFALLPGGVQAWAWIVVMQIAVALAFVAVMRALRPAWPAAAVAVAATLTFYPLWVDSVQGQANALVLALTTVGVVAVARGRETGGLALGAATALKLTPVLALVWLGFERRLRAAAFLAGGVAILSGIGALARPADSLTYVRDVVPQLARGSAFYSNQSLSGVMSRLFTANPYTDPWVRLPLEPLIALAFGIGLVGYWAITLRGHDPLTRALTFLPLLPLLSSVTWEHHLIVILPLCWLVIVELARRGWPRPQTAVFVALLGAVDLVARWRPGPGPLAPGFRAAQTGDPLVLLCANSLFLATLAFLLLSPWLLRAR